MNKRKFRRIDFRAPAVIEHGTGTIYGEVNNLCNTGIFIKAGNTDSLRHDDNVLVSILFSEGPTAITVTIPAKIVRKSEDGIAFHSNLISMYPLLHLEHLFIYRKGKPEQLTEDFCEYISSMPLARSHSFE